MSSRFTTFLPPPQPLLIIIMGKKLVRAAAPGIDCLLQLSDCSFVVLVLEFFFFLLLSVSCFSLDLDSSILLKKV
jgi:hypothetical protein